MSKLKINNQSGRNLSPVEDSLNKFYPYSKQNLGFDRDASFNFISDPDNATKLLGKTAYYDPESYSVTIYVDGRHPKDIMRSISHELVHHAQNCRGEFSDLSVAGEQGYAQKDPHLREMEREAYEKGNMIFRDWEDSLKSSSNTIYERIVKSWGYTMLNESDTKYQKTVKSKHSTMKTRINKTGANKTKAAPFDKGSSSERAKSAPPSAGAALEENGENKLMDNKAIEEVVRNVLRRVTTLEEAKPDFLDLDKDGDKKEPMSSAAKDKDDDDKSDSDDDKDMSKVPPQLRKHVKKNMKEGEEEIEEGNCGDDEDDMYTESKKTLKHKLKKARRAGDKKEMRKIKKHLNESNTLKDALVRRKSNINAKLMEKWFKTRE